MAKSDMVLGKHSVIEITTDEGPVETYPIVIKFNTDGKTSPHFVHLIGHQNRSIIGDTGAEMTASLTTGEKSKQFSDFYARRILGKKLLDKLPEITIKRVTTYRDGSVGGRIYSNVHFDTESTSFDPENHMENVYSIVLDPDHMEII
jgi:hypothetical protein